MRSSMLAACVALLLLTWPVTAAQIGPFLPPDSPSGDSGERVIMDLVLWAVPGPADETCLQLPPGHLAMTLRLEAASLSQSVRYRFSPYWYRPADSPSEIDASVTSDPRTFEATLAGGRYCYALVNESVPSADADTDDTGPQAQLVAVKMTLTPY
jgi:hypothetical protein